MNQRIAVHDVIKTDQPFGPDRGRADRAKMAERLAADRPVVALDMSGVALADSSWSREAIGGLLVQEQGKHCFYLERASAILSENVDAGLLRRGLCILSRRGKGDYEVLGKAPSDQVLEVLAIVERQGETTARAICAAVPGLAITACNNRLRDLMAAGLVVREEGRPVSGGKEFVYRRVE